MIVADPIFIIGTERSGSNLLRLILNTHSEITVPHPPHIMAFFSPLEPLYGDLASERNWTHLTDDVIRHVNRHIYPWPTPLNRSELLSIKPPRDLFDLFAAIYEQHRIDSGKSRWCCKSTFMIHHTARILRQYPQAQMIWLIRDPRDVAVSSRDSVFNPYHPYYTARLWNAQQLLGRKLESELSPRNLLRVHYETLISNPEETTLLICRFLGMPFEPGMLRFFETEEARASAKLARDWRNTAAPIMSGNSNQFREKLSPGDIAIVEGEAVEAMDQLGYSLSFPLGPRGHGFLRRAYYRILNELYRLRTEYRSLRENQNHWLRWSRSVRIASLSIVRRLP